MLDFLERMNWSGEQYTIDEVVEALIDTLEWSNDAIILNAVRRKLGIEKFVDEQWSELEGWEFGDYHFTGEKFEVEIKSLDGGRICVLNLTEEIFMWVDNHISEVEEDSTVLGNPCLTWKGDVIYGGDSL